VVKSSQIEGAALNRDQVRSSIARHLGLDIGALGPADRPVDGAVEMMLDATENDTCALTDVWKGKCGLFWGGSTAGRMRSIR
jgi:Fic family protein